MRPKALLLPLVLLLSGCAAGYLRGDPFDGVGGSGRLTIVVQNDASQTATITALASARSVRLGTLSGSTEGTFSISWRSPDNIQFRIRITGGGEYLTPERYVGEGTQVLVWVREPLEATIVRP